MSLEALIFDVDGTLAETEELHRRAFNAAFAEAGLDWVWSVGDYERLLRTTGGKERIAIHAAAVDAPLDPGTVAAIHARKTRIYAELVDGGALEPRPGVRELIGTARSLGLRLGIATTTSLPNVEALCRAIWQRPSDELFDVIAAGDEVPRKKPDPGVYLLCLERLGVAAGRAIAFEDSANGLKAARAAGLRCVVTPAIYTRNETFDGADTVLDSLAAFRLPGSA